MIDPRFYTSEGPIAVAALFPGAEVIGDIGREIASVAALGAAGAQDLSFHESSPGEAPIATGAGVLLLRKADLERAPADAVKVISPTPRATFARVASSLHRARAYQSDGGAHGPGVRLEDDVVLGPNVTLGPDVQIGGGSRIGPGVVIGPGVKIGRRARIGANAVIECALLGDDVTLLAGAVLGQPGFGVAGDAAGPVDVPHFGRVIIEDRVSLGANTAVDRGLFDDTIVSEDAKIDNLCHIAHNVVIGRGVLIAAFGGISGSSTIGDGAILGGRVGVADHITVGRGAMLGGAAVVLTDVPDRGKVERISRPRAPALAAGSGLAIPGRGET